MSKFNKPTTRPAVSSPVVSEARPSGETFEGAPGYARDLRSELFLLAVTNMVGERTFYEGAGGRSDRFERLVRDAAVADPAWTSRMLRWLRGEGNMRSASLVGAAEFVRVRLEAETPTPEVGRLPRATVAAVLQRADEPGEMLAYWTSRYGRAVPKPVKRGAADAVRRLYTERSLLKYDTDTHGFRFADVLELVHASPDPGRTWQGDLFRHAIDRRHGRGEAPPESLPVLFHRAALMAQPVETRRGTLLSPNGPRVLDAAGMTWEALAGWLQGPMDAAAWEAVIPSMGVMGLVRNLRNFDEAGVSDEVASQVAARISDPEVIARSRMLPFRFLSAYRAAPNLRWAHPLEQALAHSLRNVPELPGRTLVMVDTSSSMNAAFSKDGTLLRWDAAAMFGVALAQRCAQAEVVSFSSTARRWGDPHGANTRVFPLQRGESLLRSLGRWQAEGFFLGGGTETAAAVRRHYGGHDRVVIVTDEQATGGDVDQAVPAGTMMVTFNLAGYQYGHAPAGTGRRVTIGGLGDAAFRVLPLLEAGRAADWGAVFGPE